MLVFGHTGLTLGAAVLLKKIFKINFASKSAFLEAVRRVDLRLVMAASLLPDVVDKPIGIYLFGGTIGNGRIYAHTLLFFLFLVLLSIILYRRFKSTWAAATAFGVFTHLIFDGMWRDPQTLFWPLQGWSFARYDVTRWFENNLNGLLTNPADYVPELAGAAVLIWFALSLLRRKCFWRFIKSGVEC